MEAAGFATGARGAAAARPYGLDLQAAAGAVRGRWATPMPAVPPRGGHLPLATARSNVSAAYGGLGSAGIVKGMDPAVEIASRAVGLGLARSASTIQGKPSYGHLACGRPVSQLPLRGFRHGAIHRSSVAVGLGGAPGGFMVAAAAARGGRSGRFAQRFAGVPFHIQGMYAPPQAQAGDDGAPTDDNKGKRLSPVDEFIQAHPRLSTCGNLLGMFLCVVFCYLSAKGDPRAALLVTTMKDAGEVWKFLADVILLLKNLFFPGSGPGAKR